MPTLTGLDAAPGVPGALTDPVLSVLLPPLAPAVPALPSPPAAPPAPPPDTAAAGSVSPLTAPDGASADRPSPAPAPPASVPELSAAPPGCFAVDAHAAEPASN